MKKKKFVYCLPLPFVFCENYQSWWSNISAETKTIYKRREKKTYLTGKIEQKNPSSRMKMKIDMEKEIQITTFKLAECGGWFAKKDLRIDWPADQAMSHRDAKWYLSLCLRDSCLRGIDIILQKTKKNIGRRKKKRQYYLMKKKLKSENDILQTKDNRVSEEKKTNNREKNKHENSR